jgi:hypothetical protein
VDVKLPQYEVHGLIQLGYCPLILLVSWKMALGGGFVDQDEQVVGWVE